MFIKRDHSGTEREFNKIHRIFYWEPCYEKSNTVMIEFWKSLMGRFLCKWFSGFRFCDVECNFKIKRRQPRRQLSQSRHFEGAKEHHPLSVLRARRSLILRFLIRMFSYLLDSVNFIWIFDSTPYCPQHWYITRLHYILGVRRSI